MHEDNEQCDNSDEKDADEVQPNSQPAHGATEEVVGGLVVVEQLLISTERQKSRQQKQTRSVSLKQSNRKS